MNAPLKTIDGSGDIAAMMRALGAQARAAARRLALAAPAEKDCALKAMADAVRNAAPAILAANSEDLAEARKAGATAAFLDRLGLDGKRVAAIAAGLDAIAAACRPGRNRRRGMGPAERHAIERVRVPLGVIGVIYESRPNVTADAGGLCLKAGNAVILRGGSDSFRSSRAIHAALAAGLREAGLPDAAIQLVPTRDRAAVGAMLAGLDGMIDVIVPRGGKGLVARVQAEARVPVFAHLDGNCHVYVDRRGRSRHGARRSSSMPRCAAPASAAPPKPCWSIARPPLPSLRRWSVMLLDAGCEVRGDAASQAADPRVQAGHRGRTGRPSISTPSSPPSWSTGSTAPSPISSATARTTPTRSSPRTRRPRSRFLHEVDSAIVLHNASTQFADGGEFGFGAEIGIATGRLHARGPVGVEQLTTFKYRVHGSGQTRP